MVKFSSFKTELILNNSSFFECKLNFDPCNVDFSPLLTTDAMMSSLWTKIKPTDVNFALYYGLGLYWYAYIMLFHQKDKRCETDSYPVNFSNALILHQV